MTEPEALDALKRAAVEWGNAIDDAETFDSAGAMGAARLAMFDALHAARIYARTVRPHED